MSDFSLYALKTLDNDDIRYVGVTSQPLKRRLAGHIYTASKPERTYRVAQWIRHHGPENIRIVLLETLASRDEMLQAEMDKIAELSDAGHTLLNHTRGGDGVLGLPAWNKGIPMSEERKELFRLMHTGVPLTEEHKDNIRIGINKHFAENGHKSVHEYWIDRYGQEVADVMKAEWFEKRSASLSGERNPMYGRTGESAPCFGRTGEKHPMFGKTHSPEAKEKIGAAFRGKKLSLEVKTKMSQAQHKKAHTDKGVAKPGCVWCNGSTLDDEIDRRRQLENAENVD